MVNLGDEQQEGIEITLRKYSKAHLKQISETCRQRRCRLFRNVFLFKTNILPYFPHCAFTAAASPQPF